MDTKQSWADGDRGDEKWEIDGGKQASIDNCQRVTGGGRWGQTTDN